MCGRYQVMDEENHAEFKKIIDEVNRRYYGTEAQTAMATGEIFPTNIAPVLLSSGPKPMKWGFPAVHGSTRPVINARQETASTSPYFANALANRRIVIPTSGFYEWMHDAKTRKATDKFRFTLTDEPILYLAGMYSVFPLPDGKREERFTILTTAANTEMMKYHDRMPVYLKKAEIEPWMNDYLCVNDIMKRSQPTLFAKSMSTPKPQQMNMFS